MKKRKFICCILFLLAGITIASADNNQWEKKQAALMTVWSENIDPQNVFPEYPRPQMVRDNWVNLNGVWDFAKKNTSAIGYYNGSENYNQKILVPFPVESALSGIMDSDYANQQKSYVYKRTFSLPESAKGKQILLHFGAVDWRCYVFVNGKRFPVHEGGYDPFTLNITGSLKDSGEQELVVHVYDPTKGGQPRGKQDTYPSGIWYTPSSGIWQTVWYEAVDETYIRDFSITPDVDASAVKIKINAENATGASVDIAVMDGENQIAQSTVAVGTEISIPVNNPKLWSPDSPFLYKLKFTLKKDGKTVDNVGSYFGMRKIELGKLRGKPYMFLNNRPVFHYGPLDQGFWPDGLHTPPCDAAFVFDLEKTKELGFNMVRKHIKIEPSRWYYYCDSLGLMVWQDMANPVETSGILGNGDWVKKQYFTETTNIINSLKNHPSIVVWIPYNEGWGQFDANNNPEHSRNGVNLIRKLDNTRLINQSSGWTNFELGDIIDRHNYSEPALYPNPYNRRASVCGETGGYGYVISNHIWKPSENPYGNVTSSVQFLSKLQGLNNVAFELTPDGINGVVYTQISDVEGEVNGFYTYDRKISKLTANQIARFKTGVEKMMTKSLLREYVLLTAAQTDNNIWKYKTGGTGFTVSAGWNSDMDYDDTSWNEGAAGFGTFSPNSNSRTVWDDETIYLRRKIVIDGVSAEKIAKLKLSVYYDEDFQLYINGILAASKTGYSTSYQTMEINQAAKESIRSGEENLFAIKCIQTNGGQYIDMGLVVEEEIDLDYEYPENQVFEDISTPEQLNDVRNDLNGFYRLTADIDLSAYPNFEPIGNISEPFRGYLFGNRHIIRNLNINNQNSDRQGLFGYASGAFFSDLEIENPNVNGQNGVGALLGKGEAVSVERVVIDRPYLVGDDYVGGIIGGTDDGNASFIKNCYVVDGEINTRNSQAGGILGAARTTSIENTYFSGTITAPAVSQDNNAGGIIGMTEDDRVIIKGVASLASNVTGGTASQFVARGIRLVDNTNLFSRSDMKLSPYIGDVGLGRAYSEQVKSLSKLKSREIYESTMNWDFTDVWAMPEDGFPVFKYKIQTGLANKVKSCENNLVAISSEGRLTLKVNNPASVWIYDASGALVNRLEVQNEKNITLNSGNYVIKSISKGTVETFKIIININGTY
ncbi:MAG: T9SS type A sorting domain-containing protein [Dysgonamonadaceae bacterium]|jgi:hypothetical protein|nr:T9SS type A sorting domain-containing protein [Dysgonamonadaceae bacterium]